MSKLRYLFVFLFSKTYNTAENNELFTGTTAGSSSTSEGWTHLSKNEEPTLNNFSKLSLPLTSRVQFISLLLSTYFQMGWLNTPIFLQRGWRKLSSDLEWMPNKQPALKMRWAPAPHGSSASHSGRGNRESASVKWHKKKNNLAFCLFSNTDKEKNCFSPYFVLGNGWTISYDTIPRKVQPESHVWHQKCQWEQLEIGKVISNWIQGLMIGSVEQLPKR